MLSSFPSKSPSMLIPCRPQYEYIAFQRKYKLKRKFLNLNSFCLPHTCYLHSFLPPFPSALGFPVLIISSYHTTSGFLLHPLLLFPIINYHVFVGLFITVLFHHKTFVYPSMVHLTILL